jgi:hypothetical protein
VGSGFRTFTAGEVLSASNVQNYLMEQSVMVFGGSAARSSAIGTANFEEGMVSYLTDTDKVEAYNGTNWVSVAPTTSQGLTLINTTSFSAVASQSVNDVFSATYRNYRIIITGTGSADEGFNFRFRVGGADASGSEYWFGFMFIAFNSASYQAPTVAENSTALTFGELGKSANTIVLDVGGPFLAATTSLNGQMTFSRGTSTGQARTFQGGCFHDLATSYTGFTFFPTSGTMTGEVSVYGYAK